MALSTTEPATTKGRATRERIVASAASLVFERGVAGTSLEDVRAAAQVSKGQLYHYFTDKGDLVHAVIGRTIDQVLTAQPALSDLSSWAAIDRWFDQLVSLQVARRGIGGCPIGRLAGALAEADEHARAALAVGFDRWQEPLRKGLEAMRDAGALRADADPGLLATATLASIQGGLVLTQTRRDPHQLRIALDAARTFLHAFAN